MQFVVTLENYDENFADGIDNHQSDPPINTGSTTMTTVASSVVDSRQTRDAEAKRVERGKSGTR